MHVTEIIFQFSYYHLSKQNVDILFSGYDAFVSFNSNTTGVTSGGGTTNSSEEPEFTLVFSA